MTRCIVLSAYDTFKSHLLQDTDSIAKVISSEGDEIDPDIGLIPGDLSDDLKGKHFVRAVFASKKLYELQLNDGSTKRAAKGIPIQSDTAERINLDTLTGLLAGDEIEGCNKEIFKRDPKKWTIQTVPLVRRVKCTYTSRVIGRDFRTYPMGFVGIPFPQDGSPEHTCVESLKRRINKDSLFDEFFDDLSDNHVSAE